jgi:DNA-binding NtrC family response regulator
VDDDETLLQLEHEVLRSRGITVKLTRSTKEAMDFLHRDSVDAIVTDMKMPGEISPLDFYRWIEQNRPELAARVVFTASHARENEASATLRKSGCPVIPKPFAIEELWSAIQKALSAEVSTLIRR